MANDHTVAEAFEKLKLFYELKIGSPEVFRNRNPDLDEISRTFKNQNFLYLPVTPDGYSVVYASLRNYSVSTFIMDSLAKAFLMTAGKVKGSSEGRARERRVLAKQVLWQSRRLQNKNSPQSDF